MYNKHTYTPIDNMILVELDIKPEDKVKIVRLEGHEEDPERLGTVIRTGRGYNTIVGLIPCNVVSGDRVLVRKRLGNQLEYLPDNFIVLKDANIMGIISSELPKKKLIRVEKVEKQPKQLKSK